MFVYAPFGKCAFGSVPPGADMAHTQGLESRHLYQLWILFYRCTCGCWIAVAADFAALVASVASGQEEKFPSSARNKESCSAAAAKADH